jgi:hypothetical protein
MKRISWLSFVVFLAIACQDDQLLQEEQSKSPDLLKSKSSTNSRLFTENGVNCDENLDFPLIANGIEVGTVEIAVDEANIHVTYDLTGGEWFLLDVNAFAGDCNAIPDTDFPYSQAFDTNDEIRSHSFDIPLENLPDCGCIKAIATVARFNSSSELESFESSTDTEYCNCDEPEEPDDENLRTQTPGGWGAPPNGNNPGAYLHANFDDAFPNGLVVGCDFTITLTSAQAVTDFLPQGGKPSSLTMDYIDPVNSAKSANNPKNVLAGHVVALTLSVTFDAWDEDFGESSTGLDDAVVTQGDFSGWTVAQVLAEAEKVLGGCDSNYSASALTEVLSAINESFVDGTTNTGFLMNGN